MYHILINDTDYRLPASYKMSYYFSLTDITTRVQKQYSARGLISDLSGCPRLPSKTFDNFQKILEFVQKRSSGLPKIFGKSLEKFEKWLDIIGKFPKTSLRY